MHVAPPKSQGALDDIMEAIEGDGSPCSYLSASLFAREIAEFGATWHGCNWSTHMILGNDLLISQKQSDYHNPSEGPSGKLDVWRWFEPTPWDWKPEVRRAQHCAVMFNTLSELGKKAIHFPI